MGNPLSEQGLDAFSDELEKLAAGGAFFSRVGKVLKSKLRHPGKLGLKALGNIGRLSKGVFEGGDEALKRMAHPIEGMREGWRASSPLHGMKQRAKAMGHGSIEEAANVLRAKGDPEALKKFLDGGGEHLLGTQPGTGRLRSIAEELSRQGWTGAGKHTKYLPVGNKSTMPGFAAMAIPDIVNAPEPTPTGEGGALETGLGELTGAAGMIAGTGVGLVPAMAMWYGARSAGSRLGRVLDRVRGGAGFSDAVSAPSPQEVSDQLENIQKYYR